ncbi:hypothetical protein H696_06152, partial [Fonticula alba]
GGGSSSSSSPSHSSPEDSEASSAVGAPSGSSSGGGSRGSSSSKGDSSNGASSAASSSLSSSSSSSAASSATSSSSEWDDSGSLDFPAPGKGFHCHGYYLNTEDQRDAYCQDFADPAVGQCGIKCAVATNAFLACTPGISRTACTRYMLDYIDTCEQVHPGSYAALMPIDLVCNDAISGHLPGARVALKLAVLASIWMGLLVL